MTRRVVFEGGIARVLDETVVSEAPIEAMMPFLERTMPTYVPIMPDHTRVVTYNPGTKRGALLVELTPVRRNLTCQYVRGTHRTDERRAGADGMARFNIQLPYQYFFYGFQMGTDAPVYPEGQMQGFTLDTGFYFWRPERLTALDQPLWSGKLWNVDENAWICWGGTRHTTESLAERVDDMILNFPNTQFNLHLGDPRPLDYGSYTDWEEASTDPLVYKTWQHWTNARAIWPNVQSLFERTCGNDIPTPLNLREGVVDIPEPPARFSVGRALQWMEELPEPDRNRFLHALRSWTDTNPEETADDEARSPEPAVDRDTNGRDPGPAPAAAPDRRRNRNPQPAAPAR